jgi:hypothetical protein
MECRVDNVPAVAAREELIDAPELVAIGDLRSREVIRFEGVGTVGVGELH